MFDRLMLWFGYVPLRRLAELEDDLSYAEASRDRWERIAHAWIAKYQRLEKYAHVRVIVDKIDKGTAKY